MADEETVATPSATDDELAKAFDEFKQGTDSEESEKTTEVATETTPDKPVEAKGEEAVAETPEVTDQKESSKLGRKYKRMESEMEQLKAEIAALKGGTAHTPTAPVDDEAEVERINELIRENPIQGTKELQKYEAEKAQKDYRQYADGYIKTMNSMESNNEELHDDIVAEMTRVDERGNVISPFNGRHTGNPVADAKINYAEAKAFVISQRTQTGEKVTFGKGDTTQKLPIQPVGTQKKPAAQTVSLPEFKDPYEKSYVAYLKESCGYSDADILNALKR